MANPINRYVVGFAFDLTRKSVALIKKIKGPSCVIGLLNGIGGKIDGNESPEIAMAREFYEETGVSIHEWNFFCRVIVPEFNAEVNFLRAFTNKMFYVQTIEEEVVGIYEVAKLVMVVPNLYYLIPMALNDNVVFSETTEK